MLEDMELSVSEELRKADNDMFVKIERRPRSVKITVDVGPSDKLCCNIDLYYHHDEIMDGRLGDEMMKVNWQAWGAQDPAVAKRYGEALVLAAQVAQDFNDEHGLPKAPAEDGETNIEEVKA